MTYQLAILDLDGTLVNSVEDLGNAVNRGLEAMQYPIHPIAAYDRFIGNGVRKLCERALPPNSGTEQLDRLLELFDMHYQQHCLDCTRPYAGIPSVLEQMKTNGIKLAVASNKPQKFTEKIVTHFFGESLFDKICGSTEERPRKPSPEIIQDILYALQIPAEKAVMIGDSDVDIQTAQNAGIDAIGCTWGFRTKEELNQIRCTFLADRPSELTVFVC